MYKLGHRFIHITSVALHFSLVLLCDISLQPVFSGDRKLGRKSRHKGAEGIHVFNCKQASYTNPSQILSGPHVLDEKMRKKNIFN